MDESDVLKEYLRNKRGGTGITHHTAQTFSFHSRLETENWGLGARSIDETNALITVGASSMGTF